MTQPKLVWFEYRLRFCTPLRRPRFPSYALLASDTLFAALVHAANALGMADALLSAARDGRLLLSSLFPESPTGKCLLPAVTSQGFTWQEADGPVAPNPDSGRQEVGSFLSERRRRAAIERFTFAANPFSEALAQPEGARFWAATDGQLRDNLLACLHVLEDSGVGGGRSIGRGGFVVADCGEIPDSSAHEGKGRLLSLVVPASEEEERVCRQFPLWLDRNGYTEEAYRGRSNRRKEGLWALAEGAEVPAQLQGAVTVLDAQDGLVHYGRALLASYGL